jgi:hypothetical protein
VTAGKSLDPRRATFARALGQAIAEAVWREITVPELEDAKRAEAGELDGASRGNEEKVSGRHITA